MSLPTPAPAIDLAPGRWRDLFSLDKREAEDHRFLERQLRRWCEARGVDAALYHFADDVHVRCAHAGRTRFPRRVEPGGLPELERAGCARVELPEALLLYAPDDRVLDPHDPELLLLAAGSRISALKHQVQEQRFQARFRGVELEALYDVGLAIASTLDLDELYEQILLRAMSLLDARRGALYLLDGDRYRLSRCFGGEAMADIVCDVVTVADGDCRGPDGWLSGATHLLATPVEIDGDPRGLLVVADKESRHGVGPFPETDRRTLSLLANQAAIALENAKLHQLALEKERLEREMELAAEIQRQLLPESMPVIPGYEVVGWNRPAQQVGGDYYDVQSLGDGRWGLVVGDVTGKGLPAALLVSTLHSALRVLLDRMEVGPSLVARLNRHIYESSAANKFITMVLAAIEPRRCRLAYLNAGHNPGLWVRSDGSVEQLSSGGMPLGLMPDGEFGAAAIELKAGDLVCLYSDGITESESPSEEEFGLERLIELLVSNRRQPLTEILRQIDRAVTDFAQGRPQGDDQTVVMLRCSG